VSMTFGRITLPAYTKLTLGRNERGNLDRLRGWLRDSTLAETKILRTELVGHAGDLIAITDSTDTDINGFYYVDDVSVTAEADKGSLQGTGLFQFDARLTFVGRYSSTELQSLLTMVDAVEDFSTTESYWWAPSIGAQAVDAGGAAPVIVERDGADGTIAVATDMTSGTNPTWSIDPSSYYDGAVELYADGDVLRTGTEIPMDTTDWYISNGLMQVRPSAYQSTSDGELDVRFHDGTAWGDWQGFFLNWAGSNKIPSWNFVSVLVNQPELVIIRLVRDAAESPFATTTKHELDLTLRRGGRFVCGLYKFTGPTAYTHALEAAGSDTVTRPGGTASYVYLDTLVSGDRIVYGTPKAFTLATREIQLNATSKYMPFWIGAEVDSGSAASGNQAADLAEQYVGQVAEVVRAVRR
jgi:hypothetical protein